MAQLASFDDAFGRMLLDHLDGRAMTAWLECDDGRSQPALGPEVFFANEDEWPAVEREALAFVSVWFDWLNPAPDELREIARGSGWRVDRILGYRDEPAAYAAVLRRDG